MTWSSIMWTLTIWTGSWSDFVVTDACDSQDIMQEAYLAIVVMMRTLLDHATEVMGNWEWYWSDSDTISEEGYIEDVIKMIGRADLRHLE